jgi:hypothetical protein
MPDYFSYPFAWENTVAQREWTKFISLVKERNFPDAYKQSFVMEGILVTLIDLYPNSTTTLNDSLTKIKNIRNDLQQYLGIKI